MTVGDFAGKPFEELTDAELDELDQHDWTAEQILTAMSAALDDGAMVAVVQLLHRLAVKDPLKAAAILAVIQARS